ncbi:uncharacterized protein LOC129378295 [Poeciliopsis prolifica]|uniref:uncharacterized protein LOC129378295 n=1 Tax=Poeciliopsis prolifica TaxID=188132 RepID=UPI0024141072|nr:uncharacterized protein LOC129378295 [Poeciliopsis prolifica]
MLREIVSVQRNHLNMMTALKIFYLLLATLAVVLSSPLGFKSVHVGRNVTLKCFLQGKSGLIFYWFKKSAGKKAQLMSEFYKHKRDGSPRSDLITSDPRFELEPGGSGFHLKILSVRVTDSATYYCVSLSSHSFEFLEGVTVHVEGSGSETSHCAFRNGTHDGKHGFYWFRGSGDSFPKLMYTHKSSDDLSDEEANTKAHSCVYDLPLNGLDEASHAVDYHCAVASCGRMMLGNTTNLDLTHDSVIIVWSAACVFTSALSLSLALSVCRITKKTKGISLESRPKRNVKSGERSCRTAVAMATNRSMRQKDGVWSECEAELSDVSQPVSARTLKLGESVTIECVLKNITDNRVWYKLTADRRLQVVATYSSLYKWSVVDDELKHRYSVYSVGINNHLTISAASWDDAGTYFCGVLRLHYIQFGSGTLLMLQGVKLNHFVIQPPKSQSVGSEVAAPFSCTFSAAQCTAEETGVMWLKTCQRSAPEVIHVSGKTNGSCKRTERGGTTCVHKLLIRDVDSDGGGTDYCAAAVCGWTQFGNVTTVFDIQSIQGLSVITMGNFSLILASLCSLSWVSGSLFQTVTFRPDGDVTLRCANLSQAAGHIFWFKLADGLNVSRISSMSTSDSVPSLHDKFQRGKFTMRSNVTDVFLDIRRVEVNDSGLYFCGFYAERLPAVFAATYLHVEVSLLHHIEEPGNLLNWILGGVVIFLAMVIISLAVKIKTLHTAPTQRNNAQHSENLDSCTQNYAALSFPPKAKSNRRPAAEKEKESCVLYAATR